MRLGVERRLLVAASRECSVIQLTLLGLVLKTLFDQSNPSFLIGALSLFMLGMAGYEVMARQERRFSGFGAWDRRFPCSSHLSVLHCWR